MKAIGLSVKSELEKSEILNRQVRNKVNITNDDVERYYKLNANKFRSEDRVRLRHILLALPKTATPEEVQAVTEKAMDLYKRIVAGADFAELAREYSEGSGPGGGWRYRLGQPREADRRHRAGRV